MTGITDGLELKGAPAEVALRKLHQFFLTGFEYSVVLRRPRPVATPLHDFLLNTRSGHCEFFASATVLLLRSLGIPARYATGYSVQEYSPLEKSYVVRRRHAHSWTLAYVNGSWIDFDTTPPVWGALEAGAAPWWEGGYDLFSWLLYRFSRWRWSSDEDESSSELLLLIVPLLGILLWRLARAERDSGGRKRERRQADRGVQPGADSDMYRLLRQLEKRDVARASGESLSAWLARLRERDQVEGVGEIVNAILPVHYRYRFDPRGLSAEERTALKRRVRDWMLRYVP